MMLCVYIYLIVKALYPGIDECPGIGRLVDAITLLVLPIGDGGLIDVGVDRSWKSAPLSLHGPHKQNGTRLLCNPIYVRTFFHGILAFCVARVDEPAGVRVILWSTVSSRRPPSTGQVSPPSGSIS